MSKYCQQCKNAEKDLGKDIPDFAWWKERHTCDVNHHGSSAAMEKDAAVILWKSSEEYGLRYTTMLSDGDSKTFLELNNVKPYSETVTINKEECVNHVSKRLGAALRGVVSQWRSQGVTLGRKGHGTLKQDTVAKLTRYYQKLILDNKGDLAAMKKLFMQLFHTAYRQTRSLSIVNVLLIRVPDASIREP